MNWTCSFCSSVNTGSARCCFVCDTVRTRASVRGAKRRARRRSGGDEDLVWRCVRIVGTILMLGSVISFSAIFLFLVLWRLQDGSLEHAVFFFGELFGQGSERMGQMLGVNFLGISEHVFQARLADSFVATLAVLANAWEALTVGFGTVLDAVFTRIGGLLHW